MESKINLILERVRGIMPGNHQRNTEQQTLDNINHSSVSSSLELTYRLEQLRREWDAERTFELNASSVVIISLALGAFIDKRWLALTGAAAGLLLQHGLQRWSPPLALMKALGKRTRLEIDEEIYALKILRGDFDRISSTSTSEEILNAVKK
jgi:hypothetical protein